MCVSSTTASFILENSGRTRLAACDFLFSSCSTSASVEGEEGFGGGGDPLRAWGVKGEVHLFDRVSTFRGW